MSNNIENINVLQSDASPTMYLGYKGAKGDKGDKGDTGATGDSGVDLGTTEPTDPNARVWVDPSGTPTDDLIAAAVNEWMVAHPEAFEQHRTNAGSPINVLTPNYVGEEALDTTNEVWYKAVGTTAADWVALN